MSIMLEIIPLITVIFHLVSGAVAHNPCSDVTLINSIASQSCSSQLQKLDKATNIDAKCGVVLDDIRPCIVHAIAIAIDHNQNCTAKEKHEMILKYRYTFNFDMLKCLPLINCTDFESVMYYLQVSCEPQFKSFVNSPTCGNLCHMAICHEDASKNNTKPKKCSVTDFQRTIRSNSAGWLAKTGTATTDICCDPCSTGKILHPIVKTCYVSHRQQLKSATNIDVQCGIVIDEILQCIISTITSDYNQTCTVKQRHDLVLRNREYLKTIYKFDIIKCLPVMNCTDFESVMYYLQVSCEPQFESFVKSPNCGNLCDMATCHEEASRIRQKSCSVTGFQRTIQSNSEGWRAETGTSTTNICCDSASSGCYGSTFVAVHVLSMILFVVL